MSRFTVLYVHLHCALCASSLWFMSRFTVLYVQLYCALCQPRIVQLRQMLLGRCIQKSNRGGQRKSMVLMCYIRQLQLTGVPGGWGADPPPVLVVSGNATSDDVLSLRYSTVL